MRWFWIADINLNEPANLFLLLGQPQGDTERVSVLYLSVWLPVCLRACCLLVCLSFCIHSSLIYANGFYTVSHKNTSDPAELFMFACF